MDQEILLMMGEDKEIWAPVDGFEGYEVSTYGRVKNKKRGNILKPRKTGNYYYFHFELNGKNYALHRLVAQAFIPNPQKLPWVDHIDRDTDNNRINNLRWCSPTQSLLNRDLPENNAGKRGVARNGKGWAAHCWVNGKRIMKTFPTFEEACAHRDEMVKQHYDTTFYNPL